MYPISLGLLRCFLHDTSDKSASKGKVTAFKDATLLTCSRILVIREEEGLKYGNLTLPSDISENIGFHMDCYRKFTAISKLSKGKLSEVVVESTESKQATSKPRLSRSVAPDNMTSPGSRVFSKGCLFCEQISKKLRDKNKN